MKTKKFICSIFMVLMLAAIGIGLGAPSLKANIATTTAAAENKEIINVQSYTGENFSYFLTTYSDYTTTIDIRPIRDLRGSGYTDNIYIPICSYTYSNRDLMRTIQDNSECISYKAYVNSSSCGQVIKTITLIPTDIERYNYDTSFIKIGDHIFDPITTSTACCCQLDIDGNGRVNILDAQTLLYYVLEVQLGNYESSWEGFLDFREDYWRETNSRN